MQNADISNQGGFVAGTLVHTDKGLIPIQNLQVRDLVLTSKVVGITEFQPIVNIYKNENQKIFELVLKSWVEPDGTDEDFFGKNVLDIFYYGIATPLYMSYKKCWKNSNFEDFAESYYVYPKYLTQDTPYIINIEQLYVWQNFGVGLEVDEFPYQKFTLFQEDNYSTMIVNEPSYTGYDDEDFELDYHFRSFDDKSSEDRDLIDAFRERNHVLQEPVYQTLYHLEVEKTHTYFIGGNGLWVHDVTKPLSNKK